MKKNLVIPVMAVMVMIMAFILVATGFNEKTDVALGEYSVSEDGTKLSFETHIVSSIGYTRGFKEKSTSGGIKPHYLTFYAPYGGINSSLGAKDKFVLELDKEDTEIYFNRANGEYELVLQKNIETGEWERP